MPTAPKIPQAKLPAALTQKLDQARLVIEEVFDSCPPERAVHAWSAGKDSTLVLWLLLDVCRRFGLKAPITMDIDQKDPFTELEAFRDELARDWGVEVLIVRNSDFLDRVRQFGDSVRVDDLSAANKEALAAIDYDQTTIVWRPESPVCNQLLKTVPMMQAVAEHPFDFMFTGIRWDEHVARENEAYFSPRTKPPHTRVSPILHFTERDVWDVTFALGLPFCPLYYQGYRSLGTKSGTNKAVNIPAWEQDLENTAEREGRSPEKEKMMAQLREWGYI